MRPSTVGFGVDGEKHKLKGRQIAIALGYPFRLQTTGTNDGVRHN
jgi:hypothetical protein